LVLLTYCAGAFVKVWLLCSGEKLGSRRTQTQHSTSSPSFNEEFVFNLKSHDTMTSTCCHNPSEMERCCIMET